MSMKPNTKAVIEFLQAHASENYTAADVAEALGLEKKSVDGIFTTAVQRKQLGMRVETEVELEDNTHAKVKFLKLNQAGLDLDTNAPDVE